MRKYTNEASLPLSMAVFLATDNYDYEEGVISATTLIKPLRQTVLAARVPKGNDLVDVRQLVKSRMGNAIHDGIEHSWKDNYMGAMKALGYPQRVIDRVKINPDPKTLGPDDIPVYLEQRARKQVGKYTVSGKFDFLAEGRIEDFKSTSTFSWVSGTKDQDYILQGSIYRWLNPEIVTQDTMAIQFIFTDWQAMRAKTDDKYPSQQVMEKRYTLMSLPVIDSWIRQRLDRLDALWDLPQEALPECDDRELWRKETVYKYYKDPSKRTRSTKNFSDPQDAYQRLAKDGGTGIVIEQPGEVVACKFCPAFSVCHQKDRLMASGELKL